MKGLWFRRLMHPGPSHFVLLLLNKVLYFARTVCTVNFVATEVATFLCLVTAEQSHL